MIKSMTGFGRSEVVTYIQRGKVDVYITYEDYTINNGTLKYNKELAAEYIACLKQMQQDFDLDYDIKVSTLSRYPDILTMEEQSVDEEELWSILGNTGTQEKRHVRGAVSEFSSSKCVEDC